MKTNKDIESKIKSTLNAFDNVEPVKVPHFFKHKTMQRLFTDEKRELSRWRWLTPQLQLAVLACVVIFNVLAFSKMNSETYDNNLTEFAENFGLSEDESDLIVLNQTN